MRTRTVRLGVSVAVLAAAGLALTACQNDSTTASAAASSAGSSAAPSTPATGSPAASAPTTGGGSASNASVSASAVSASAPQAAGSAGPQLCAIKNLQISTTNFDTGAGTTHFQIEFHNTGSTACTLTGFPGVSYRGSDGAQLGNAAVRTTGDAVAKVTLIPGAHALAEASAPNGQSGFPTEQCKLTDVASLRIFPPGSRDFRDVAWKQKECVGASIHALTTGPVHPVS